MSSSREYSRADIDEFLSQLRRDIAAAQLRVVIDRKLDRVTPGAVRKLATMPMPPDLPREPGTCETTGAAART